MSFNSLNRKVSQYHKPSTISKSTEDFLRALSESLQIPDSRYEQAEKSYKSVGEWLKRTASTLKHLNPQVYTQGSFALGTVIKPVSDEDDYDVDMICAFNTDRTLITQKKLKTDLKFELEAYAKHHSMQEPESHRRCVRLIYADGAQFHIDATPAIPDRMRQLLLEKNYGIKNEWSALSIVITDEKHWAYNTLSEDWPHSNPKGYRNWFHSRMKVAFEQRRNAIRLLEKRASVEEIPDYRVTTPLQSAIQILKRHRDMTHEGDPDNKPISIIINTLSALAYNQESTIQEALYSILQRLDGFISYEKGGAWVANPTDPLENFADKWQEFPERETAFYDWLEKARNDFSSIANLPDIESITEVMSPRLGAKLMESVSSRAPKQSKGSLWRIFNPPHKETPPWTISQIGRASISAKADKNGWRPREFKSDSSALPKGCQLTFTVNTNVPEPFDVFWQVVNTGKEAYNAGDMRGGFSPVKIDLGWRKWEERTSYAGSHTIEAFIVKNGLCAASTGPFIVNIQ